MADIINNIPPESAQQQTKNKSNTGGLIAVLGLLGFAGYYIYKKLTGNKTQNTETPVLIGGGGGSDIFPTDEEGNNPTTPTIPETPSTPETPTVDNTQTKINNIFDVVNNSESTNAQKTASIQSAFIRSDYLEGGHGGVRSSDLYAVNDYGMQSSIGGYPASRLSEIMLADGTVKTQQWYKDIKAAGMTESQAEALAQQRVNSGSAVSTISDAQRAKNIADNAYSKTSPSTSGGSSRSSSSSSGSRSSSSGSSSSSNSSALSAMSSYTKHTGGAQAVSNLISSSGTSSNSATKTSSQGGSAYNSYSAAIARGQH